jgi:hypothetical protein
VGGADRNRASRVPIEAAGYDGVHVHDPFGNRLELLEPGE